MSKRKKIRREARIKLKEQILRDHGQAILDDKGIERARRRVKRGGPLWPKKR